MQAPSTVASNLTFTLPAADGSSGQVLKTDGSGNLGFVSVNTPGAAASFTQVDITAQGDLRLQDTTGGEYGFTGSPSTVASNVTFTLPGADGSSGQVLKTDGSGNLSFISVSTPGAAASFTQVDITAQGDLRLQDSSGGEYVALQAPATLGSNYTLTFCQPVTEIRDNTCKRTEVVRCLGTVVRVEAYSAFSVITSNTSLVAKGQYISNSSSTLTHTLPSGSAGDTIYIQRWVSNSHCR